MGRRKGRGKEDPAQRATVDESEWKDWWELRNELGKRLGGRDATGMSDPEVLAAARAAKERERKR